MESNTSPYHSTSVADSAINNLERDDEGRIVAIEGTPLVPQGTRSLLNERQHVTYRAYREQFVHWLYEAAKAPQKDIGYAARTADRRSYRAAAFERWYFNQSGYSLAYEPAHADQYLCEREGRGLAETTLSHDQKALVNIFDYWHHRENRDRYEPDERYTSDGATYFTGDYLTRKERRALREAALEFGTIPHYSGVTPSERTEWNRYLAQRFGKPLTDIGPDDWDRANDMKIASLVMVSLDTGLRPCEVERSSVTWCDIRNERLTIPPEDAAKARDDGRPWFPSLTSETTEVLAEWLRQREQYPKYEDRTELWLTRKGNPYQSQSLSRLMSRLADAADVPQENRQLTWYSIRRGLATGLIDVSDLSTAQTQLRHKSPYSTIRYDQAPHKRRQDALRKLG